MAELVSMFEKRSMLGKRDVCCYDNGQCYYCHSGWYSWGRWVALGLIILFGFIAFLTMARLGSMRRRRHGLTPYQGTAWMLPKYSAGGAPPAYIENNPPHPQPAQTGDTYYGNNGTYNQGASAGYNNNPTYGQQPYQGPAYPPQAHAQAQPYYPPTGPPPQNYPK